MQQFETSANRKAIVVVDGNAKIAPAWLCRLFKRLVRGYSHRPHGKDILSKRHPPGRHKQLPPPSRPYLAFRHRLECLERELVQQLR